MEIQGCVPRKASRTQQQQKQHNKIWEGSWLSRILKCKAVEDGVDGGRSILKYLENTKYIKEIVSSPTWQITEQGANVWSSVIWNKLEGVKGH